MRAAISSLLLWTLFLRPSASQWAPPVQPMAATNTTALEDEYIRIFGNSEESQFWDMARSWNLEHREPRLKRFCKEAHRVAGLEPAGTANLTAVKPKKLVFSNPEYITRFVDVIVYGINGYTYARRERFYFWLHRDDCWYMTAGESDDCVFYLTHASKPQHTFKLVRHVCGIHINLTLDRNEKYF